MSLQDDVSERMHSSKRRGSSSLSNEQAARKLYRAKKLLAKAHKAVSRDGLDIIKMAKGMRKIDNLAQVMLTKNQQSMLVA